MVFVLKIYHFFKDGNEEIKEASETIPELCRKTSERFRTV